MSDSGAMDFRGSLVNEIVPFWERSVDHEYGGYLCSLDELGNRIGPGEKHIVTMCRQIYTFSLGHRLTGNQTWLDHAAQGVDFFLKHFLDETHGGFVRSTDRQGVVTNRTKYPYGEYFAIYALAEYYRASGDTTASAMRRTPTT
jgi:mannobiose 2-epimerase